jgi:hypothetical protein
MKEKDKNRIEKKILRFEDLPEPPRYEDIKYVSFNLSNIIFLIYLQFYILQIIGDKLYFKILKKTLDIKENISKKLIRLYSLLSNSFVKTIIFFRNSIRKKIYLLNNLKKDSIRLFDKFIKVLFNILNSSIISANKLKNNLILHFKKLIKKSSILLRLSIISANKLNNSLIKNIKNIIHKFYTFLLSSIALANKLKDNLISLSKKIVLRFADNFKNTILLFLENIRSLNKNINDSVNRGFALFESKKAEINKVMFSIILLLMVFALFVGLKDAFAVGGSRTDGQACAYDAQCVNLCDNQTSIGLATDQMICFSATQCTGGQYYCGHTSTTCQYEAGASQQCDDRSLNTCVASTYYCDSNCIYRTDGDTSEGACNCIMGSSPSYWDLGGETSATTCCDDAGEHRRTRVAHASMDNGFTTDSGDTGCCTASNKCVANGNCVTSGSTTTDADSDGDNDYCNAGTWYDCNTNDQCATGYSCVSNDCVDNIAPSCSISSITESSPYAYASGSTIYYNSAGSGSFNVIVSASDSGSGIDYVNFPAVSTLTGSGADSTATYQSSDVSAYSWTTSSTYSGSPTVTCYDNAANSNTASFTVTRDITAPSEGSITYSEGYYTSASISISYSTGTDGGSGLNLSSGRILRRSATLSTGSCGSYGSWSSLVYDSDGSHTDNTVSSGNCYQYRYEIFDNVLNGVNYTSANTAKVDTSAPTCSLSSITESSAYAHVSGSTIYYNSAGSGNFNVIVSASDTQSGISNVTFPAISTLTGSGADSTSTYQSSDVSAYSWTTSSTYSSSASATCYNNAGLTNPASYTITRDITAPDEGSISYDEYHSSTSISITYSTGTDSQSGLNLSSGRILRRSATISDGSCGSYGGWTSLVYDNDGSHTDNTVSSGNCYQYRYEIFDNVLNGVNYTSETNAKVDTSPPSCSVNSITESSPYSHVSGTTIYYNSAGSGNFNVIVSTADTQSGIGNVVFPEISTLTGSGSDSTAPYQSSDVSAYSWTTSSTYSSSAAVSCYNNVGLSAGDTYTITRDITAPSEGSINYTDKYYSSNSVPITYSTGTDGGSGLNLSSGRILRRNSTLSDGSCDSYGAWTSLIYDNDGSHTDNTVSSGNCYQYRYEIFDNVLNGVNYTSANTAKVYNEAPTCTVSEITESSPYAHVSGTTIYYNSAGSGNFNVIVSASDDSGISNVTFPAISTLTGSGVDSTAPYQSSDVSAYSWDTGSTYSSSASVTCYNNAGFSDTDTYTITRDITAPEGGSITYTDGISINNQLILSNGLDSGSGVNASKSRILRRAASYTGITCDSYGEWTQVGDLNPGGSYRDTSTSFGNCYQYRYEVFDNVHNGVNFTSDNALIYIGTPVITAISISPTIPNTTSDLNCYATVVDELNQTLTVEYWWYKNNNFALGGNKTSVINNTNTLINTLDSGNTNQDENWNCTIRATNSFVTSIYNSTNVSIEDIKIYLESPVDATIVDRDSVAAEPDSVELIMRLGNRRENIPVTFKANLTDPDIAGQENIVIGNAVTNATGHAKITWSGRDIDTNKMYAGNYNWWANSTGYIEHEKKIIHLYGGLILSFRYSDTYPESNYTSGDIVEIHVVLESEGPETRTQLNSTYLAQVNATLTNPLGVRTNVTLIDPEGEEPEELIIGIPKNNILARLNNLLGKIMNFFRVGKK